MCTDNVKFLFSDKCTMSLTKVLEFLSSLHTEHQSVASGSRSHHSRDHHNSGGSDRDNMEEEDDIKSHHPSRQSRFVELNSPLRSQAGIVGT